MALPVWADRVILPPNSTGLPTGMFSAAITGGTIYLPVSVLTDTAGNSVDVQTTAVAGTERGLVTRSIPGGNVAAGATDAGNPVKVGGVYFLTPPALTAGQRGNAQLDLYGNLKSTIYNESTAFSGGAYVATIADADVAVVQTLWVGARNQVYNGTTWDRARGDITNGLDVDVTRLPTLAAGTNNIGDVDVLTLPALMTDRTQKAQITDGTRDGTVKAASTAAAAADTALVVGISPQNLPVSAALADATANPTTTLVGGLNEVFGGTTWDRSVGNMANVATGDTGAKTASFVGATQTNRTARGAIITVRLGTVSGTTPTLTAQLQFSPDDGTTWIGLGAISGTVTATSTTIALIVYPGATGATTGSTQTVTVNAPLVRTWRLNYVIAGTTPSFTFTAVNVNYIAT